MVEKLVIGRQAESDRSWVGVSCVGSQMGHFHPYLTAVGQQVETIERWKREVLHGKNINNLEIGALGHQCDFLGVHSTKVFDLKLYINTAGAKVLWFY